MNRMYFNQILCSTLGIDTTDVTSVDIHIGVDETTLTINKILISEKDHDGLIGAISLIEKFMVKLDG